MNFYETSPPTGDTLSVFLNGLRKVTAAGWYTYKANVSGGVGPYHYDWFREYCYFQVEGEPRYCAPNGRIHWGIGADSLRIYYPSDIAVMRLTVHVYDAQTMAFVGVSNATITNFSIRDTGSPVSFSCDLGEHFFPVPGTRFEQNGSTIDTVQSYYRRNGCTGYREWSPTDTQNGW